MLVECLPLLFAQATILRRRRVRMTFNMDEQLMSEVARMAKAMASTMGLCSQRQ